MANSLRLQCKLGSIIVHIEELLSPDGHAFDRIALDDLLADAEVKAWRDNLQEQGLLPAKRN